MQKTEELNSLDLASVVQMAKGQEHFKPTRKFLELDIYQSRHFAKTMVDCVAVQSIDTAIILEIVILLTSLLTIKVIPKWYFTIH